KNKKIKKLKMESYAIKCLLPPCIPYESINRKDYVDRTKGFVRRRPIRLPQEDPSLITGHYAHNLKVNGIERKTRTWPAAMDWREEYRQFLLRAKWCNEELFEMFFVNPPVDYKVLVDYLRDSRKSIYMHDYSPEDHVALVEKKRIPRGSIGCLGPGDYQTTYGHFHNRLHEMEPFRSHLYPKKAKKDLSLEKFAADMRKLFTKYSATTYFDELCVPALLKAKNGNMPAELIDRYQFRKY
ncbi:hypothetical protein KR074_008036, partial [Drosophila pseudoananassae]